MVRRRPIRTGARTQSRGLAIAVLVSSFGTARPAACETLRVCCLLKWSCCFRRNERKIGNKNELNFVHKLGGEDPVRAAFVSIFGASFSVLSDLDRTEQGDQRLNPREVFIALMSYFLANLELGCLQH